MTENEKLQIIANEFTRRTMEMKKLPREEAKKMAEKNLVEMGFFNPDGTKAVPYA